MTMRLDIVTNDAGELVRREHARDLGAGVVVAIYRLAKLAQMHDLGNQAFLRQLDQTHQMIGDYCLRSGSDVNVLFADKATFVAGQLLKGSRGVYENAAELGALLERLGGSELLIHHEVSRDELNAFAEQISVFHRTGSAAQVRIPPRIKLRAVADAARLRGIELEKLSPDQRIVRAYASAVVIMRRFFEDLGRSRYILPRRIKRIAQSLVDLSDAQSASFLGVMEARNENHDEAGRAVNTAILAVSIARESTNDRAALAQIAMAAMMHDVARPRALAIAGAGAEDGGMAGPTTLSEDQEDRLAAGAAAVLTALGRVNEPTVTRTVLAFESLWLRRRTWIGPVYWGARAPTLQATIISIARRYNDLLTPEPGLPPPTTDYAIAMLAQELTDTQDRTVLRMLVSALGLLPTGTVVKLSTGDVAEVTRGARGIGDRPRVRLVNDSTGQPYPVPKELELAQDPRITVTRVLSIDGWKKGLADAPQAGSEHPAASVPPRPSSPPGVAETMGQGTHESLQPERTVFEPLDAGGLAASAPVREATARGNLEATPLPHVLVYMLDHSLTGSVVFEGTSGGRGTDDTIYFVDGVPAKIRLNDTVALLGEVLVEEGAIDETAIAGAVEASQRLGTLLGEFLVGDERVSREALAAALEHQLLRKIGHLANLAPEIEYAFYQDADLLEGWGGEITVTHPLNPILASVRHWSDRARVRATLTRIGKHPLMVHAECDLSNLAVAPEEQQVVEAICNERIAFPQLLARGLAAEEVVASLVYSLAVTRQFAFTGQQKGPMGIVRPRRGPSAPAGKVSTVQSSAPPKPGREASARPAAMAAGGAAESKLAAPSASMRASGPLAAPRAVSARPVATAARPNAPAVRPVALKRPTGPQGVPARIVRPAKPSARPDAQPPADFSDSTERIKSNDPKLEATGNFRLAERALRDEDLAGAERYAQNALEGNPDHPDFVALLAWVRALSGAIPPEEAVRTMSKILIEDPSNERSLFYRAKLLWRMNRLREALHDFTELLAANPHNAAAQEEMTELKAQMPQGID
jgi:tetratricopeptide (TPR) repeat protein